MDGGFDSNCCWRTQCHCTNEYARVLAHLLQDALICSYLEKGSLNWFNLFAIQKVCENYLYRSHASSSLVADAVHTHAGARHVYSTGGKANKGTARRQVCKNYNTDTCKHDTSHLNNGFLYEHFCTFCATKGSRFSHSEQACRNKGNSEGKANGVSPHWILSDSHVSTGEGSMRRLCKFPVCFSTEVTDHSCAQVSPRSVFGVVVESIF